MTQWQTKMGNLATNHKVKVDFTLPEFSATEIVMWDCHVDNSTKRRCNMILDRDISTKLRLNFKLPDKIIEGSDGPFERCTALMINLGTYVSKY